MAGRAIGYSDFYKGNSKTPNSYGSDDDEEDGQTSGFSLKITMPKMKSPTDTNMVAARKAAMRRRLMKKKAG